jgi:hypothetical protein
MYVKERERERPFFKNVCSFIFGHLGCFHDLAILSRASMDMDVQVKKTTNKQKPPSFRLVK